MEEQVAAIGSHWQGPISSSYVELNTTGRLELAEIQRRNRLDLQEVLEDRHSRKSTIATSQLPIEDWHGVIGDATFADAILDRLIHSAYRMNLRGEYMRKTQARFRGKK